MKHERLIKILVIAVLFAALFWFGLRPLLAGNTFKSYLKGITTDKYSYADNEYAVAVIGSEPEGIAAAVASARTGLKTILVTEDTNLGSYIESGVIVEMKPDEGIVKGKKVVLNKGIYEEIFGDLKVGFSTDDYIASVRNLIEHETNLEILYNCSLPGASVSNNTVESISVTVDGEERLISAGIFIDATRNGTLLDLCKTPYKKGSEDINLPDSYMPLEFNFMVSGVKWEDLNKIQKTSDFALQFRILLMRYERFDKRTKFEAPSFIKQSEDTFIITGLEQWGVDVNDPEDVKKAYADANDEALMLIAYLKSVLIPFADCTFKQAPEKLFIPEYKHFEGRYALTVSDILENRDFKNKVALASAPVDAGKFVDQGFDYTIVDPPIYSIPLGSIIPVNLDNVLMPGSKASFRSLAATSAGIIPTSITVGESSGLTAAYCYINHKTPADLLNATDKELKSFENYLGRGGVYLADFSDKIVDPSTKQPLEDNWAYGYIKELAEYGLIAGGSANDFRVDSEGSCDVFSILMKNAILKMAPKAYSLDLDEKMKSYEKGEPLTGETACAIILETRNLPYEKGMAFETAQSLNLIPKTIAGKLTKKGAVTMDIIYCLTVETANAFK